MILPEYIEKCRQITDACGWPEDAKYMALRNTILLGLKNPKVYQKCLEEDQDSLTAERVIEIATLLYNSDCQRSIMQTLSTATAAATAIQQGSTQIHKVQAKHQKGGNQRSGRIETRRLKIKSMVRQKDKVVFVVEQSLLTPDRSVRPRMLLDTSVERKDITKLKRAARAKQVKEVQLVNLGRFKYMVYKHR